MGGVLLFTNILTYADDMAILAPSLTALQLVHLTGYGLATLGA